jgi:hypothetical protein
MDIKLAYKNYYSRPSAETITELFRHCRSYGYGLARSLGYDTGTADDAMSVAIGKAWVQARYLQSGCPS